MNKANQKKVLRKKFTMAMEATLAKDGWMLEEMVRDNPEEWFCFGKWQHG